MTGGVDAAAFDGQDVLPGQGGLFWAGALRFGLTGTAQYSYDANGNLVNRASQTLTWDVENHLQSVKGAGADESYRYDENGQRLTKTSNGVTTVYVNPAYEVTNGVATTSYSFNGQRIAQRKDGMLTYFHADQVGSTLLATAASGAVVGNNQPRYFAYGRERTPSLAALPTDYTYTGQKQDGSGLVYMNARYYDPVIGQFISPDSLVPDPTYLFSYNRFMYVNGNPLRYNDPSGHGDPTAGALPQPNSWQTALDAIKLAATSGVTVIAASEVGPPAMAAAATVTVVGGGYVAVQWAMQDMGPDVPPLYPTLGHNVGDGNISITIPVPSSTTMTSGVPLTPGAQTQSTGATAVNQPAQQIVEPLPAQQKGSNIVVARKYSSSRKHEVGGWGTLMGLSDSKAQEVLNNGVEDPNSKQVYGYYQGQLYEFQPDNVGGYHGYPIPGNQAPPAVLRMMRDAGTISNAVYNKLIQGKR